MENKRDYVVVIFLFGIFLVAAFGPLLVVNGFYVENLRPDWVQAISSIVAVVVALFLPYYLRLHDSQRQRKMAKDRELVALHTIYEELLCFHSYFMSVRAMLAERNYDELASVYDETHYIDPRPSEINSQETSAVISSLSSAVAVDYLKLVRTRSNLFRSIDGVLRLNEVAASRDGKNYDPVVEEVFADIGRQHCEQGVISCSNILHAAHNLDDSFLLPCFDFKPESSCDRL